jgi:hypothetical protein
MFPPFFRYFSFKEAKSVAFCSEILNIAFFNVEVLIFESFLVKIALFIMLVVNFYILKIEFWSFFDKFVFIFAKFSSKSLDF